MFKGHLAGICLLSSLLFLPVLISCGEKEQEQKEPSVLLVGGNTSCSAVIKRMELSVKCDIKWTATLEDADWAKIESQTVTEDGGAIVLSFECNRDGEDRSGVLVVSSGSKSVRKTITQTGLDKFFMPREIHLAGTAKSPFIFDSPYEWTITVTEGAEWIDIKTTSGPAGYTNIPVLAKDPNENVGDRRGSLTVTIGTEAFSIPVIQSQKDILLADNTQVSFGYKGGDFAVITQSNVSYQIECAADWVRHIETKALNQATELFTVERNGTVYERTAVIRFTPVDGTAPGVDITVKQGQIDAFLLLSTPGFYKIGSANYFLGNDGWNLCSSVRNTDGSAEFRLLNRSDLSVITLKGYDPDAEEGSSVHLSLTGWKKAGKFLIEEYDATIEQADASLIWLKTDGQAVFIVKK